MAVQQLRLNLPVKGVTSSVTSWGTKILYALQPKNSKTYNRSSIVTKFNRLFKKLVHIKKILKSYTDQISHF